MLTPVMRVTGWFRAHLLPYSIRSGPGKSDSWECRSEDVQCVEGRNPGRLEAQHVAHLFPGHRVRQLARLPQARPNG